MKLPHQLVLITNGGPHPEDKWATASANEIANLIEVDENSKTAAAIEARKAKPRFALDLADEFEAQYGKLLNDEKEALKANPKLLWTPPDVDHLMEVALASVAKIVKKFPDSFQTHFALPTVIAHVKAILREDFEGAAHMMRSWHCDQNPGCTYAQAWLQNVHG